MTIRTAPQTHIYGQPLPEGYVPTTLEIHAPETVTVEPVQYPPSRTLHMDWTDEELPVYDGTMQNFSGLQNNVLSLQLAFHAQAGDVIKFSIVNPADPAQTPIPFTSRIVSAAVNTAGLYPITTIVMKETPRYSPLLTSSLLVLRQGNPPQLYFAHVRDVVDPNIFFVAIVVHLRFAERGLHLAVVRVGAEDFR